MGSDWGVWEEAWDTSATSEGCGTEAYLVSSNLADFNESGQLDFPLNVHEMRVFLEKLYACCRYP
jgi:hypothetical protein